MGRPEALAVRHWLGPRLGEGMLGGWLGPLAVPCLARVGGDRGV